MTSSGEKNWKELRDPSIVKGAALANAKADADLQDSYVHTVVYFITRKIHIDAATKEMYIAKEKLAQSLPPAIRAQIVNHILGDYDVEKALLQTETNRHSTIRIGVGMDASCFKIDPEQANNSELYALFCLILGVSATTPEIKYDVVLYNNEREEQDFFQSVVVRGLSGEVVEEVAAGAAGGGVNKRGSMVFRSRAVFINGLLDNRSFSAALASVHESRYPAIRAAVNLPAEAFMVELEKVCSYNELFSYIPIAWRCVVC
jgi:hypothetical protein